MQVSFPQKSTFDTVTANKIYCPDIDTLGASISMRIAGTERAQLSASALYVFANLRIAATKELRDAGNNVIIASDDAGHIDQLGRVDGALKYADDKNSFNIVPALALLSGGAAQPDGTVDSVASETLIFELGGVYPYMLGGQLSRLAKFRVDIDTPNNGSYVTSCEVFRIARDDPAEYSQEAFPDDIGNGTTGAAFGERTITSPFTQSGNTHLKIVTVLTAGTLTISQIRITLDMDT